jgi:hypothetical protein
MSVEAADAPHDVSDPIFTIRRACQLKYIDLYRAG